MKTNDYTDGQCTQAVNVRPIVVVGFRHRVRGESCILLGRRPRMRCCTRTPRHPLAPRSTPAVASPPSRDCRQAYRHPSRIETGPVDTWPNRVGSLHRKSTTAPPLVAMPRALSAAAKPLRLVQVRALGGKLGGTLARPCGAAALRNAGSATLRRCRRRHEHGKASTAFAPPTRYWRRRVRFAVKGAFSFRRGRLSRAHGAGHGCGSGRSFS
jgi:hypothetical protein